MKALFRTLLLWCLLVGVPFQGFASAAMLLCGAAPMQSPMPSHMQSLPAQHDGMAMTVARDHSDCHEQAGASSTGATGAEVSAADEHAAHGSCASAAACCIGAALAPYVPTAPALPSGRAAIVPFLATAPAAVHLAGPERPPMSSRA